VLRDLSGKREINNCTSGVGALESGLGFDFSTILDGPLLPQQREGRYLAVLIDGVSLEILDYCSTTLAYLERSIAGTVA